jgi:DNA-binding Lrp family transcriptional regulator
MDLDTYGRRDGSTATVAGLLDPVDRALVHALQIDPRLPFARIAEVLGVSDQTIARRYRRLRATGTMRVVALPNPWRVGNAPWIVRLRCVPDAAAGMAAALARRPDTGWVHLLSGGAEIDCTVLSMDQDGESLVLPGLTRTSRVVAVTAHSMLRIFAGSKGAVLGRVLADDQVAALRGEPVEDGHEPVWLETVDRALLELLGRDARLPLADLARATGWSESHVRRRLELLRSSGTLFYEVDMDPALLGFRMAARLWITATPARLASLGEDISQHAEIPFVAATTGPTNLVASVYCRDAAALYDYLTGRLGTLEGIRQVETAPIMRTLKRACRIATAG